MKQKALRLAIRLQKTKTEDEEGWGCKDVTINKTNFRRHHHELSLTKPRCQKRGPIPNAAGLRHTPHPGFSQPRRPFPPPAGAAGMRRRAAPAGTRGRATPAREEGARGPRKPPQRCLAWARPEGDGREAAPRPSISRPALPGRETPPNFPGRAQDPPGTGPPRDAPAESPRGGSGSPDSGPPRGRGEGGRPSPALSLPALPSSVAPTAACPPHPPAAPAAQAPRPGPLRSAPAPPRSLPRRGGSASRRSPAGLGCR